MHESALAEAATAKTIVRCSQACGSNLLQMLRFSATEYFSTARWENSTVANSKYGYSFPFARTQTMGARDALS